MNRWQDQNLELLNELKKYRVGLTLRQRGLGQLNSDMSLSNKAGKLQNGHLEKAREDGGLRSDGERTPTQKNPTVRKQRGIISGPL